MSRAYCILRYALTCHTFFIRRYRIALFLAFLAFIFIVSFTFILFSSHSTNEPFGFLWKLGRRKLEKAFTSNLVLFTMTSRRKEGHEA